MAPAWQECSSAVVREPQTATAEEQPVSPAVLREAAGLRVSGAGLQNRSPESGRNGFGVLCLCGADWNKNLA